jgi:hypothetical protein
MDSPHEGLRIVTLSKPQPPVDPTPRSEQPHEGLRIGTPPWRGRGYCVVGTAPTGAEDRDLDLTALRRIIRVLEMV